MRFSGPTHKSSVVEVVVAEVAEAVTVAVVVTAVAIVSGVVKVAVAPLVEIRRLLAQPRALDRESRCARFTISNTVSAQPRGIVATARG